MAARNATVDKRRVILDAAVRVFARQGFHTCRVSDIADEAGVAYGLVYHYFQSKEQVLTGWIFGVLPESDADFEQAKLRIVDTICGGLDAVQPQRVLDSARR